MVTQYLSGLLVAWAAAQLALGVFFCLAYSLARREVEYLLFGLTAVALAVATAGTALEYASTDPDRWRSAAVLSASGLIVATPLHLHFLLCYARVNRTRFVVPAAYAVCAVFLMLRVGGWWTVPGTEQVTVSYPLGMPMTVITMILRPHAMAFFSLVGASLGFGSWLLFRVYRSGRREALFALLGSLLLALAVSHDILLVANVTRDAVYAWPHAFLVYAFCVASTLLHRYHRAAGELDRAASSLRERMAELQSSYQELTAMEGELLRRKQLAAVGQLAAAIAHEVRNPLAVICNACSGLRRPRLPEADRGELLSMIDEEAARLNGLVADLVRFARPVEVTWSKVDLRELLERAAGGLEDRYDVTVSVPDESSTLATVMVDPSLLAHALGNLLHNARQAMPEGGPIVIRARAGELEAQPCVRIEVRDEGEGMSRRVRERALQPFFSTRSSSNGLGLPIVHRIVQAHGGELVIESAEGAGTTVALLIPVFEPDVAWADRPSRRLRCRPRAV